MFANLKLVLRSYTSLYGIFMSASLTLFCYNSSNSYFVSVHVVVRFMHNYRNFVADNDYAIFYSNPRSIQASTPEKRVPCVVRAQEQVFH